MTDYIEVTIEHLGSLATDHDLKGFLLSLNALFSAFELPYQARVARDSEGDLEVAEEHSSQFEIAWDASLQFLGLDYCAGDLCWPGGDHIFGVAVAKGDQDFEFWVVDTVDDEWINGPFLSLEEALRQADQANHK